MFCKICNSNETKSLESKSRNLVFHYCKICNFYFKSKDNIISEFEEKERYLLHNNQGENYFEYLKKTYDYNIKNSIKNFRIALDFGSGSNPVFSEILKNDFKIVKIFDKYFANDNSYTESKYDFISIIEVIEHLKAPLNDLEQLKNLLNEDGVIAIKTNLFEGKNNDFLKWWYIRDITHISFFSEKTFVYIAKKLEMQLRVKDNVIILY